MTPDMKDAYEVALSILKPSKSQLEHGLELHKNSLVFDTYSFQPYAAIDGKLMAETIGENASVLEIHDLKEDMMMTRFVESERERIEYENAWKASGVTCIFQNAGEEGNAINKLIKRLAHYTYTTDMMGDFVTKAVLPEDIVRAKNEDRRVLYFSGNGVPLPQEWVSEEEELRYIRVFFQLGIRMMHLTYNRRNKIGDGCAETSNAGLSEFGKAVVKRMNKVGVIVDIAHSGWRTSLEAARISERPVVASHSTSASIKEHIRSKPDEVIKAVADSGGYIGICCIPRFLGGTGDISAMMKHIDFVAKKFGFDYVGIGTDKGYSSKYAEEEGNLVNAYPKSRTRFEGLWPEDPFVTSPEMIQSMAWTNWPLFTVGLVMMGYSDYDIQKILGGNALRVANAVLS
ncbi:MAG: hypothetical protein DHS20C17_02600 [Cyclobacteriaceae bacterium]|nr:MAG: hypothetical protein DHS20C17_02600 [Cyclobacteriaceae bacterium]